MQRFLQALREARLTSAAMLKAMLSTQIVAEPATDRGPEREYGLGVGVGAFDGHRWAGHNGGAPGVNAEAAYPDDRTAVVVLSARDPPTATALFRQVRAVALGAPCPVGPLSASKVAFLKLIERLLLAQVGLWQPGSSLNQGVRTTTSTVEASFA